MKLRVAAVFSVILILALLLGSYGVGSLLIAPRPMTIGTPPADVTVRNFEVSSASGSSLKGWKIKGKEGAGVIVLAHGVRGNRLSLLERAKLFRNAGYSVILFDFQSHGESLGKQITFGYLEAADIRAILDYAMVEYPDERIGVVGISLGGAALLLSDASNSVSAIVLEGVYSDFITGVKNRIEIRLGPLGRTLSGLLLWQVRPRLGFSASELQPINNATEVSTPAFVIGGSKDRHTKLNETESLYRALKGPKDLWIVEGAVHQDFYLHSRKEYKNRVVSFFLKYLKREVH